MQSIMWREIQNHNHSHSTVGNYQELWKWSVDNYANFWEEFFDFAGIKFSQAHDEVNLNAMINYGMTYCFANIVYYYSTG